MKSPSRLVLVAAATTLLAGACGGSDSPSGSGSTGPVKITVGNLPVAASAALTLGRQKGFFTVAGLELTIKATEAPSMVPSLLSDQIQFAFLNPQS